MCLDDDNRSSDTQFSNDKSSTGRLHPYRQMEETMDVFKTPMFLGAIHIYWMKKKSADEMTQVKEMAKQAARGEFRCGKVELCSST